MIGFDPPARHLFVGPLRVSETEDERNQIMATDVDIKQLLEAENRQLRISSPRVVTGSVKKH